ncbi:hypothetical protein EZS27_022530 [termite gut metagenome]|uniref:Uncharacterized protein n=1 Tax=termite gut metagenome TaxID=433724 RepID=A0A5J4R4C7_9ZZZZ
MNRNADKRKQPHDYDIVEGPVADDKITRNITKYLQGEISKEKFLEMLTHSNPNHQICFCTVNSLQMLEYVEKSAKKSKFQVENISEPLVEQLMLDLQIGEMKAADIFYSSATFTQLADTNTKLYEKEWQEIYKILKTELNFRHC